MIAPGSFTHPLLSREGFSKWDVLHAVSTCSDHSSTIHQNWQNPPPVHFLSGSEQTENISHLDRLHSQTLDKSPKGRSSWTCSHASGFSCLCLSGVGLNVSKSPEREGRGSFTHCYCHDNCYKGLACDWCFSASFHLTPCHVKEVQPFLHSV